MVYKARSCVCRAEYHKLILEVSTVALPGQSGNPKRGVYLFTYDALYAHFKLLHYYYHLNMCTVMCIRGESPEMETWQHACCLWRISKGILHFLFRRRRHNVTHAVGKANTMPALFWKIVFRQGVGWLRLDKCCVCCLGPNLSHQGASRSCRCIHTSSLTKPLILHLLGCTNAVRLCESSLPSQELRFKFPIF